MSGLRSFAARRRRVVAQLFVDDAWFTDPPGARNTKRRPAHPHRAARGTDRTDLTTSARTSSPSRPRHLPHPSQAAPATPGCQVPKAPAARAAPAAIAPRGRPPARNHRHPPTQVHTRSPLPPGRPALHRRGRQHRPDQPLDQGRAPARPASPRSPLRTQLEQHPQRPEVTLGGKALQSRPTGGTAHGPTPNSTVPLMNLAPLKSTSLPMNAASPKAT